MEYLVKLMRVMGENYSKEGKHYIENIETDPTFIEFKHCLEKLTLEDMRIDFSEKNQEFFYDPNAPHLKYMKIFEEDLLGMGIFFLHPKTTFTIHDHPGMMVATKVLDGSLTIKSYNFVDQEKQTKVQRIWDEGKQKDPEYQELLNEGLEVETFDIETLKAGGAVHLTSNCKNAHEVTGLSNCAMMDIFIPNDHTRHYYHIMKEEEGKENESKTKKLMMDGRGTGFSNIILDYKDYLLPSS